MMYEASERLRNDDSLAYDLFMVAYLKQLPQVEDFEKRNCAKADHE